MKSAEQIARFVDACAPMILECENYIWKHPETGYREWNTSAYMEKIFEDLGYTLVKAGNIPGFYADLDTGKPGPKIAVFGELDSLICRNHPDADPSTGAVHACGHNVQCAILAGVAAALKQPGALDGLSGSFRLISVPAEELIELGYREGLREQGIIRYFGGKPEFVYRGYLDGVDMAMMLHTSAMPKDKILTVGPGSNGCLVKNITYKGKASHAGGNPQGGINALYAAMNGLNAVNSLRETFTDNDHIRFHPIMTEAGVAVNAIPETAKVESYVRGANFDAIVKYNKKVNLALAAGAATLGAGVELSDRPGYFPLNNDKNLIQVAVEAAKMIGGENCTEEDRPWGTGCTDMGDISALMPAVHPYIGGVEGTGHGKDYFVTDPEKASVTGSKVLVMMAEMLLCDEAALAKKVLAEAKPVFASKEDYLKAIDAVWMDKDAVVYNADGTVTLDYTNV